MFKSVNRLSILKFVANDGLTSPPRSASWTQIYRRSSGLMEKKSEEPENIANEINFSTFLRQRWNQARRSFCATVESLEDCKKLLLLCEPCGGVKNAFHYDQNNSHIVLIEMNTERDLHFFMNKMKQPFYNYSKHFVVVKNLNSIVKDVVGNDIGLDLIDVSTISSNKFLNLELSNSKIILKDLIEKCYENLKVNEFEIRKKFLMCREIEVLTSGFLPKCVAYPFGSSVNGFGINGSDLDIALLPRLNGPDIEMDEPYFHVELARKHLGVLYDVLDNFTSWNDLAVLIRHARVPILKFKNALINLDCDLSLYNSHGVAVSQMYYTLASFDWRIRALVIFIKLWANKVGIVSKSPGNKLTSFSVSALVIFFLQQIQMLPPLKIFPCKNSQYLLNNEDFILESTLYKEREKCNNDKSIDELCKMFFEYYKTFKFHKWGISIKEGKPVNNVERYPIFIENPIHLGLNVSQNVKKAEIRGTQDLITDTINILNSGKESDKIRKIFSLSLKGNSKFQKDGQS